MRSRFSSLMQVACFLFFFCVELRVKAAIDDPKDCSQNSSVSKCLAKSDKNFESLSFSRGKVQFTKGSIAERQSNESVKVMSGLFSLVSDGELSVTSLYGDVILEKNAKALIEVKQHAINIVSIDGQVYYQPRGEVKKYNLPNGFATYMSRILSGGVAEAGFPRAAELDNLIKNWSQFYKSSEFEAFRVDMQSFKTKWDEAVKLTGPWYKDTYERELASHNAEVERQRLWAEKQRRDEEKYKTLFRKRSLEGL
jgi:hypothetical protein